MAGLEAARKMSALSANPSRKDYSQLFNSYYPDPHMTLLLAATISPHCQHFYSTHPIKTKIRKSHLLANQTM